MFRDDATDERARAIFFAGEIPDFQVIIPDFGVVEGPFQITSIEYSGQHDGEAVYELSLASAGAVRLRGDLMANPYRGEVELDGRRRAAGDAADARRAGGARGAAEERLAGRADRALRDPAAFG